MAQSKSGTFTGDGSNTATIRIGFEPDVLVVESDLDYTQATWAGIGFVVFAKGKAAINFMKNTTDTSASTYSNVITANADPYGADGTGSYRSFGTYSDGDFTIKNKTNNYRVFFVNDQTYSWTAYKK